MIDKEQCVHSVNKTRDDFIQFIKDNSPATIDVNFLIDRVRVESINIDDFDSEEMHYLNILSMLLYEFFIEDFKPLEEYLYIRDDEFYHFFPFGVSARAYFIYFDFKNEKNVRMNKLKHPKLMRALAF